MDRLGRAQNHPANIHQDVMIFAGFCDDRAELERHVENCEERAASYVSPAVRRRIDRAVSKVFAQLGAL